jgi:hypothetical protein
MQSSTQGVSASSKIDCFSLPEIEELGYYLSGLIRAGKSWNENHETAITLFVFGVAGRGSGAI